MFALACYGPLPVIRAADPINPTVLQETPEEQAEEKPADNDPPPKQKVPADGGAPAEAEPAEAKVEAEEAPKRIGGIFERLIRGLILGPTPRANAGTKKTKRTDPRAPFNQKLSTLFKKAQTQFKAGETKQSLDTLQRLLEMPEDALYEASPGKLISIRSAAHRLLAQLPAADLDRYRQQYGGLAKRELQQAIAVGSSAS